LLEEAGAIYRAIESVLESGKVTGDLKPAGKPATTSEVGDSICNFLSRHSKSEAVSSK
jgi:3-isopropylmalate dehydrogenase